METNAIFSRSYSSTCFMKWGLISIWYSETFARHCFREIFYTPIIYAHAMMALIWSTEACINTFPPVSNAFFMNRLDNLKYFLASSSVLFSKSIFRYSKYLVFLVYYLEVTFSICVIPRSKRCLDLRPVMKLPK